MMFLHIAIGFRDKQVPVDQIQNAFPAGAGWARYAPNCWILYTSETPYSVATHIRTLCSPEDSVFVCEVNMGNRYGWLEKEIWDWIKARSSGG